jgi:hypothetical protein
MSGTRTVLPYQKLTEAEKKSQYGSVRKWAISVVDALDGLYSEGMHSDAYGHYREAVNLDLINGVLNPADFDHIISEHRLDKGTSPNRLKNYPLIPQITNLLIGEKIKRPFNFRVIQTNADAVSSVEEKKKELLIAELQKKIVAQMQQEGIAPPPQEGAPEPEQPKTPEEIEKYMKYDYQDVREVKGQQILEYLKEHLHINRRFTENFKNFLATATPLFYIGTYQNEPQLRNVNLLNVDWDRSPDLKYIEDSAWVRETEYISASEVYDRYYDELSDTDVKTIEAKKGQYVNNGGDGSVPTFYHSDKDPGTMGGGNRGKSSFEYQSNTVVRVIHVEWKALKKIAVVTYIDENRNEQKIIADETFSKGKFQKGEVIDIKWHWINEVWEATKIAGDIYINLRPKPNQVRTLDNLSKCKLGYVGLVYDYCLVDLLKSYQYLYNVVMYRFEHAIAMAKGKAILFDIAQIPRSEGFDVEKWIYYLTTNNIAFINSAEDGKDGTKAANNFNQFQVFDMTLAASIQYYVTTLEKIEQSAGELVGVTPQRRGQITSSELVGNVERSVTSSSHITEHLFDAYANLEKRVMERLIDETRMAWRGGKKVTYILDDGTRTFLELDEYEFANSEFGVFVSNSTKSQEIMNTMKQLAHASMQSGNAVLSDIVKMLKSDSVTEQEKILEMAEEKAHARQMEQGQQQQEGQAQLNQQMKEMEEESKQADHERKMEELEFERDTKVQVAEINAFKGQMDQDINDNNVPDQLEIERLRHETKKLDQEKDKSNKELALKDKELNIKDKEANNKKEDMAEKRKNPPKSSNSK